MIDQKAEKQAILVAGATGRQGGAVLRHLLQAGFRPRALTRNPESTRARALRDLGVDVAKGDMSDLSTLIPAMEGVYGVFSVQDYWAAGPGEEIRQGENMGTAAREAGVRHFVYSSLASADRFNRVDFFETKYVIEKHLRWIGLPRTILRPVLFMEDLLTPGILKRIRRGHLTSPLPRDRSVQVVAAEDLGAFATAAFQHPELYRGRTIEIAGDEVTGPEAAAALSSALGRPVSHRRVPPILLRALVGKPLGRLSRWLQKEGFGVDIPNLRREFPEVRLTDFRGWLEYAPLAV